MATITLPDVVLTARPQPGVTHYYCCDPDLAHCGADISNEPEGSAPGELDCPLCLLVKWCAICGTAWTA